MSRCRRENMPKDLKELPKLRDRISYIYVNLLLLMSVEFGGERNGI